MRISYVLDIINSIAVFQLIFFSVYLFLKGSNIPSTSFLKLHLISQLLSFFSYFYFSLQDEILRPFLVISYPSMFLWGPTFYFYIRSRLYKNFRMRRKLLVHGIPSLIVFIAVSGILIRSTDTHNDVAYLGSILFYFLKVQLTLYILYSLYIIHRYQKDIRFITSADESRKLDWLLLFTYGILFASTGDMILNSIPGFKFAGLGYILFWLFINVFFFKAIIQPDQFLGIDENKLRPVKLSVEKSNTYYKTIEDVIKGNQLFLDPDLSLHNVAQAVKMADRMVSQAIKQSTNLSFIDYINKKRIEYAKNLLITTSSAEKNILEILYESGFNSKSVFNSQFKKYTGKAPTDYRKNYSSITDES